MFKRSVVYAILLGLLNLSSPLVARAELVGTLAAAQSGARAQDLAVVNAALARSDVQERLVALGVDPSQVTARVAALTDNELSQLATQIDQMPAGGDGFFAVVGIVFVILLILELVGAIDIFKKFP